MSKARWAAVLAAAWAAGALAGRAEANERRFVFAYESGVLAPGSRELELWSTWRVGRTGFYSRFDHRLELEQGLTDRTQGALYLNWKTVTRRDEAGAKASSAEFGGVSLELKHKFLDPVADPLGLAAIAELTVAGGLVEPEVGLIADKRLESLLLAWNTIVEPEWEFEPGGSSFELTVKNILSASYFLTPRFSAGFEALSHSVSTEGSAGFRHSALFLGPCLSYGGDKGWVTLSVLKQLPALKRSQEDPSNGLVLDDLEKLHVRVLASIPF